MSGVGFGLAGYKGDLTWPGDFNSVGGDISRAPKISGFTGATEDLVSSPAFINTIITAGSVLNTFMDQEVLPKGVESSLSAAVGILSITEASRSFVKIVGSSFKLARCKWTCEEIKKLTMESLKCTYKTASFVLAMAKNGAFALSAFAKWSLGSLKTGINTVLDIVGYVEADRKGQELEAQRAGLGERVYSAQSQVCGVEKVRAIGGFALHLAAFIGTALTVAISPYLMLSLGVFYTLVSIVHTYVAANAKDTLNHTLWNNYELVRRKVKPVVSPLVSVSPTNSKKA